MTTSARLRPILLAAFLSVFTLVVPAPSVEAAPAGATAAERASLMTIYDNLGGAGWTNSTNWGTGDPCTNNWYGITCDVGGNVTGVVLNSNNLIGNIGDIDLSGLTNLEALILDSNPISGDIGGLNLSGLTNLRQIFLQQSQIGGSIGGLNLSGLGNLESLNLRVNQIGGDIGGLNLSGLSNLEFIILDDNQIGGDIGGLNLSGLTNLRRIFLYQNQIGGDIGGLNLSGLSNLETINLHHNQIGGDIGGLDLTGLGSLTELHLYQNQIGGSIGGLDLSGSGNLEQLTLGNNQIGGSPGGMDFSVVPNLLYFHLNDNLINGTVPDLTGTNLAAGNLFLCGGYNIVDASGNAAVDAYAEANDDSGWLIASGCPIDLLVNARCSGDNLKVTVTYGDTPLEITGSGRGLPQGAELGTEYKFRGPGIWENVTVTETGFDNETINLGDFDCHVKSVDAPVTEEEEEEPTPEPAAAPIAALILTGEISQTVTTAGDTIIWTFTVTNVSDIPSDPQSFSAILPDGLSGVTVETTQGSVITTGPPTAIVDLGSIPAQGSVTITITGTWSGGDEIAARQGVRARVMPGRSKQDTGDQVCVLGMVADQSLDLCVTNFPSSLPATGGQPVEPVRRGWFAAVAAIIGAAGWMIARRRQRQTV
ncbi:MAG: leucine-rich repeat domain-containing protein [Anaerolineae bacterium]|nr:leucine-rich repeat domain-containing protein [Anaerolineae bacterium]